MAVSGLLMPPLQNLFQSWSILLLSSGLFCSMLIPYLLVCAGFWQFSGLLFQALLLALDAALQFFDVFFRRQPFRLDAALIKHAAHALVVLYVLFGNGLFAVQCLLQDVVIGHFGG